MAMAQDQASYAYAPGSNRLDALLRIVLAILYTTTLWPIVALIGGIGGLVFAVLDWILQLLRGDDGLSESGTLGMWGMRLFLWPIGQATYIILGGEFPILP